MIPRNRAELDCLSRNYGIMTKESKDNNMKRLVIILVVVFVVSNMASGAYTYTYGPGTNFGAKTLLNSESMLVNGGGGGYLGLAHTSYAKIESTTPLGAYFGAGQWEGGIWVISAGGSATRLEILGGEIGKMDMSSGAHADLYGGKILSLYSYQQAPTASDKHIDIFCKSYGYNSTSGMLTGMWGDDSAFSIQLVNVSGYTPAIDNINFTIVPEPLSLMLLGLGGLAARRYARR
jgi:hypothetical protein